VGLDNQPVKMARIIYHTPVADPGSDTQLVRLEMPNPTGRSGLQVSVEVPTEAGQAR
jgi:hypothetical protein